MTIKIIALVLFFIAMVFSGGNAIGARLSAVMTPEAVIINAPEAGKTSINYESDVLPNSMPAMWVLCNDVPVRGAPLETANILYTLTAGTEVPLRELGRGYAVGWVMIRPVEWIPMSALCKR